MHTPLTHWPTCHFKLSLNLLHKAPKYAQGGCGDAERIVLWTGWLAEVRSDRGPCASEWPPTLQTSSGTLIAALRYTSVVIHILVAFALKRLGRSGPQSSVFTDWQQEDLLDALRSARSLREDSTLSRAGFANLCRVNVPQAIRATLRLCVTDSL